MGGFPRPLSGKPLCHLWSPESRPRPPHRPISRQEGFRRTQLPASSGAHLSELPSEIELQRCHWTFLVSFEYNDGICKGWENGSEAEWGGGFLRLSGSAQVQGGGAGFLAKKDRLRDQMDSEVSVCVGGGWAGGITHYPGSLGESPGMIEFLQAAGCCCFRGRHSPGTSASPDTQLPPPTPWVKWTRLLYGLIVSYIFFCIYCNF